MQSPNQPATLPPEPVAARQVGRPPYRPLDSLGRTKRRRLAVSSLLLVGAVLLSVSMGVSWYELSVTGGGLDATVNYYPGSSYTGSHANGTTGTGGFAGSGTYSSLNETHVGQLYEALLIIGIMSALSAFVAMGIGFLAPLGKLHSRHFLRVTIIFTVIALVAAALAPSLLALDQSAAFNADASAVNPHYSCPSSPSSCNSFWESQTMYAIPVTWGPSIGWYLALVAAVVLFGAFVLVLSTRRRVPGQEEDVTAVPPSDSS